MEDTQTDRGKLTQDGIPNFQAIFTSVPYICLFKQRVHPVMKKKVFKISVVSEKNGKIIYIKMLTCKFLIKEKNQDVDVSRQSDMQCVLGQERGKPSKFPGIWTRKPSILTDTS